MRFGRGRQKLFGHGPVHPNAALADLVSQGLHHIIEVHQLQIHQAAKDALELGIIGRGDVDQREACLCTGSPCEHVASQEKPSSKHTHVSGSAGDKTNTRHLIVRKHAFDLT